MSYLPSVDYGDDYDEEDTSIPQSDPLQNSKPSVMTTQIQEAEIKNELDSV